MKLKIIPPRRPPHFLSSDEISAVETLLMLAHWRDDSSSPPDSRATHPRTTDSAAPTTNIVSKKRSTTSEKAHECKICHKVFSSGAALGGHQTTHRRIKSSHNDPTRPCNTTAAATTTILDRISLCSKKRKYDNNEGKLGFNTISDSSDGVNNSGLTSSDEGASNTRIRLDIDLNLPPPEESC